MPQHSFVRAPRVVGRRYLFAFSNENVYGAVDDIIGKFFSYSFQDVLSIQTTTLRGNPAVLGRYVFYHLLLKPSQLLPKKFFRKINTQYEKGNSVDYSV